MSIERAAVLLVLLWSSVGAGQPARVGSTTPVPTTAEISAPDSADPHGGAKTWLRPAPAEQSVRDAQLPPAATGAIFVPAMTDPVHEPDYVVLRDGDVIAKNRPGHKTFVQPGEYDVVVGSGGRSGLLEYVVVVVEGRTTFVPVEWSGLVVDVVESGGTSFRGGYEILSLPDYEYIGVGFGASVRDGERLSTWLLPPGKYLLIPAGGSYQPRRNFFTFRLPPGELVQVRLVMDPATNDFLGAGEVFTNNPVGVGWRFNLVLGGTFEFNRSDNVLEKQNGSFLDTSVFTEAILRYSDPDHLVLTRLSVEVGGRIFLPSQPFVASADRTDVEGVYNYRILPWLGPYGRVALRTGLLPSNLDFPEPTTVRRLNEEGELTDIQREVSSALVTRPFSRVELRIGAGAAAFEVNPVPWFNLTSRVGAGFRQVWTHDLFRVADTPNDLAVAADLAGNELLTLREEGDVTQLGLEGLLILQLNLSRWFYIRLAAELFEPFDALREPVITFDGTAAVRLASFASLNYVVDIEEDPALSPNTQIDQSVILRFAYQLF